MKKTWMHDGMLLTVANDRWLSIRHADGSVSYPLEKPPQPATGYQKNVTPPRGRPARPEDAFPESCCEGSPPEKEV